MKSKFSEAEKQGKITLPKPDDVAVHVVRDIQDPNCKDLYVKNPAAYLVNGIQYAYRFPTITAAYDFVYAMRQIFGRCDFQVETYWKSEIDPK